MNFFDIANLVIEILSIVTGVLVLHHVLFGVIGFFARKKFPATDEKLRYGIIIPARNEENVVGNLIDSIKKSNYPQDKLQIFVIAHNCTDRTAEICRRMGVTVYEYNNPAECTMGYAFKYLFNCINQDYGTENYDGFFLFNADNIVDANYFDKMNDAFIAEDRKSVITSYRNSKNFGSNVISACYGLYFVIGSALESRGRTVTGCSTRVQGTGYLINSEIVRDEWQYVTLTEDWEFTADRIINDTKIVYCDDAIFYDEQPTSLKVTCRQRLRWAKGHLLVCVTRLKDLLRALFTSPKKGGGKHKVSIYDLTAYILPLCFVSAALLVLSWLVTISAYLYFGGESMLTDKLITSGWSMLYSYGVAVVVAALVYVREHKRIKNVSVPMKILSVLACPLFMALSFPLECIALFKRNVGWKAIPHTDKTNHETLNGNQQQVAEDNINKLTESEQTN